jgi:hypothetical protein
MGRQAKTGPSLERLVALAIPDLQEAERQSPRTGPGAKPVIPDWVIAALIMIVMLRRKKSKSAQFRFLHEQRQAIATWLGDDRFPSRSCYFRRYGRAHRLYQTAIRLQGLRAIAEGVADPQHVAIDKSLIAAMGLPYHQRDREAGRAVAGVDTDAAWGYSEHDQWVYGFSFEVVVSATPGTTVFPLLVSADIGSAAETRTGLTKLDDLPPQTRFVFADSGYDANALGEKVEYNEQDRRTGRRFLCPENPRNKKRPKKKRGGADAARAKSRQRRKERRQFLQSARGRRLYARRKKTVEPFHSWFKSLFELEQHVWHRGLDNNRTQLLAATFCYQLLVRSNHRTGNKNGRVRWIIDAL